MYMQCIYLRYFLSYCVSKCKIYVCKFNQKLIKIKCFNLGRCEFISASKKIPRLGWAVGIPAWCLIGLAKICVGSSICIGIICNMNIMTTTKCGTISRFSVYSMLIAFDRRFEGWEVVFIHEGENKCIGTAFVRTWRT